MSARSRLALPRRGHQTGHQNPGNNLQIGAQHDDEKNAARSTPRTVRGKYGSVASVTASSRSASNRATCRLLLPQLVCQPNGRHRDGETIVKEPVP